MNTYHGYYDDLAFIAASLLGQTVILVGAAWLFAVRRGVAWDALGLAPAGRAWLLAMPPLAALLVGAVHAIDTLGGHPVGDKVADLIAPQGFAWADLLLMLLVAAVAAPLAEELLFRGLLFGWLRRRLGLPLGVLLSSIAFGAVHLDPQWALYAGSMGIVLAMVYELSGSLWTAIALHASYNALSVGLVYAFLA